jgi:uncharacterized protein (TIGR03067 family)
MWYVLMALLTLSVFTVSSVTGDDKKLPGDKTPKPKLEGTYTIESGERDGKAIPAERIKGALVAFTADTIIGTDKDKKEFFSSTYTLDDSAKPMKIMMKSKPMNDAKKDPQRDLTATPETPGLIEVNDDTVKIIYALPGGKGPTTFKTAEMQHLFILKRQSSK